MKHMLVIDPALESALRDDLNSELGKLDCEAATYVVQPKLSGVFSQAVKKPICWHSGGSVFAAIGSGFTERASKLLLQCASGNYKVPVHIFMNPYAGEIRPWVRNFLVQEAKTNPLVFAYDVDCQELMLEQISRIADTSNQRDNNLDFLNNSDLAGSVSDSFHTIDRLHLIRDFAELISDRDITLDDFTVNVSSGIAKGHFDVHYLGDKMNAPRALTEFLRETDLLFPPTARVRRLEEDAKEARKSLLASARRVTYSAEEQGTGPNGLKALIAPIAISGGNTVQISIKPIHGRVAGGGFGTIGTTYTCQINVGGVSEEKIEELLTALEGLKDNFGGTGNIIRSKVKYGERPENLMLMTMPSFPRLLSRKRA